MMIETMTSIDVFIPITKTSTEGMGITMMRSGSEDVVKKRSEGGERKKSEG